MDEQTFLEAYDPGAFPQIGLTVDLVLLSIVEGRLCALLQKRADHPAKGMWALPGGFVRPDEGLEDAARRILGDKAHMQDCWLEQLYSFGAPDRDPRMRIVTVAYYALLPREAFAAAMQAAPELVLAELDIGWTGEAGGPVGANDGQGEEMALAFDHAEILGHAVKRLRGKIDYAPIAFSLLPDRFTLRELQEVHEAILGRQMAKPPFRRRMIDQGWIEGTGEFETGTAFRPAELYRHIERKGD
ncbi:MAG: NUDIX domain-containing protein [Sphingomonadaceae bacterium]|nr:NUDIX domain-containing protein [Sphingomonadaceae bacterium]